MSFWDKAIEDVVYQLRFLLDENIEKLKHQKAELGEMAKATSDSEQKGKLFNKIAEIEGIIKSLI